MDEDAIRSRFQMLAGEFDERRRRLWAAAEARSAGRGGVAAVSRATGLGVETIRRGVAELEAGETLEPGRVRRAGGGRKALVETDSTLLADLERLVDEEARGDPESPLRWTAKSVRQLAAALGELGHQVHYSSVPKLLRALGYSLQSNRKAREGSQHPDRDAQFQHINATAAAAIEAGEPVISVDTKKKELVGDFHNAGREWRPKGEPELVRTHDFKDKELGKAIPYGIYDLANNEGWVSVGIDHDTAQFAVASIQSWWEHLGRERFPNASTLTITADCGGSNGNRTRLWKLELQRLADETGLAIQVCHFPPGTSKWNKIEHRLFSFITMNWRAKPLVSRQVIIDLIAATTTSTG
ncbi:MAG: ISAzo13 family transposase, partial [Actinobacteria bacterium]|nr:ISAzo13 family transposase [Actinomycetota bacterium]